MDSSQFKKDLTSVLLDLGFKKMDKSLRRDQGDVSLLIALEKGFGNQWFISVGFWLTGLGELMSDRVEQTHVYLRLDRLVPTEREIILAGGDLDSSNQPAAFKSLLGLLTDNVDARLRTLGTEAGLREAMNSSKLSHALVRKEARQYIENSLLGSTLET